MTTLVSTGLVFLMNLLLIKGGRQVALGAIVGLAFFTYVYLIAPTGDRLLLLYSTLLHGPSLLALLMSTLAPLTAGLVIQALSSKR